MPDAGLGKVLMDVWHSVASVVPGKIILPYLEFLDLAIQAEAWVLSRAFPQGAGLSSPQG
jgi:hypothetical protein